jgi:predicted nucleic acid-binding protein
MTLPVVLDSDGLDALCHPSPPPAIRALLREAYERRRDVLVPAVVCAEACRGAARTRGVEAAVARHASSRGQLPPVRVVITDFDLARQVGAVLHGAGAGSADMVDAHVLAVCARHGGGLVVTADAGDIERLAQAVPSARVVARPAR